MGYYATLKTWADNTPTMAVEHVYNGLAHFVTVRRDDGFSATGTHPTNIDKAARSAARLYKVNRKHH